MIKITTQSLCWVGLIFSTLLWGCQESESTTHQTNLYPGNPGYALIEQQNEKKPVTQKLEFIDFFWYGCPHCNAFQNYLAPWLEKWNAKINYQAIPIALKPEWVDHAKAFYAAQALGELFRFHPAFYEAIHVKKLDLSSERQILQFVTTLDIDAKAFAHKMNTIKTQEAILAARQKVQSYGVNTTPTLVLEGKYRISLATADGYAAMLKTAEKIIQQHTALR